MMRYKLCSFCKNQVNAPLCEVTRRDQQPWHSDSTTNDRTRFFLICAKEEKSSLTNLVSLAGSSLDINEVMRSALQATDPVTCNLEQSGEPWIFYSVKQASEGRLKGCPLCEATYESLEYYLEYSDLRNVALLEFRYKADSGMFDVKAPSAQQDDVASLQMHLINLKPRTRGDEGRRPASVSFSHNFNHFIDNPNFIEFQVQRKFTTCQRWLDMCRRDHACDTAIRTDSLREQKLPTRLLYVKRSQNNHPSSQNDPVIRLVETSDLEEDSVEYATLSYCWGYKDHAGKLTSRNYDEFCRKVPFPSLPKTIRDAVEVVLGLDLKYLWVDAVCIKQDSLDDWSSEAASMVSVYSRGIVNIAATAAKNCAEGLFVQDIMSTQQFISLGWSKLPAERSLWSLDSGDGGIGLYEESITRAPLLRRGWAFQEMALAPRTIHFAKTFVWWECRQATIEEDGTRLTESHQPPNHFMDASWESLVEHYAPTQLTMVADRLVAFAGIVEVYAHQHGYKADDYIAGLWREDLIDQLLWYVHGRWQRSDSPYVAPSWSWASLRPGPKIDLAEEVIAMKFASEIVEMSKRHPALRVFNAKVSPRGRSFFGQVDKGSLDLGCFLHKMTYEPVNASLRIVMPPSKPRGLRVRDKFRVYIDEEKYDGRHTDGKISDVDEGYLVPMSLDKHGGIWALLLKLSEGGLFERIGVARSGRYNRSPWWWNIDSCSFKSRGIVTPGGLPGGKSWIRLV